MQIKFLDLNAQYESIRPAIESAVNEVMRSCAFAGGPFVESFEREFAEFCRCRTAVGVGSGTEALWLALSALGVGPGDEVITVPNTFIATAEAISFSGAKPVFADIDSVTYTLDPTRLEAAVTGRTKAIIPVHIFGQMADMGPIMDFARAHRLAVIEDACQAHGAEYKGHRAGSIGDMGCFSFYPGKNLGAYGEAGAVVTNNEKWAETMRLLRDHGQTRKYHHGAVGWNARMDGIQGAVLSVKLKHLADWNERRRRNALLYNQLLSRAPGVTTPVEAPDRRHVFHIYAVRSSSRDALREHLAAASIETGIHYPVPLHLQPAYKFLKYGPGSFPAAENCMEEFLSLPMYPELSAGQIERVAGAVIAAAADRRHN